MTLDNICPLCNSSTNLLKLHLISIKGKQKYFCWNCTAVWPKRENSFIDELKNKGEYYTWGKYGSNVIKPGKVRNKLLDWKINYLKKIFKLGGNRKKIVDFGSGPGITLEASQILGIEAIGIESDKENYEYCKSRGFNIIHSDFNKISNLGELIEDEGTLILFNNSLIYNKNIFDFMHKINAQKSHNIDIAIHDQNYFLSTRNPISVLDSKKSGFMLSSPSLKKLMTKINLKTIYSENYFGTQYLIAKSSEAKLPEMKISFFIKLIHYFYSYFLGIFTPIITFWHLKIYQPIKVLGKDLINTFKSK